MGSNGAGKTTLFNLITGFLRPRQGKILFNKMNVTKSAPYSINRKGVGRTFQDLRLITKLSVKDNIKLVMKNNPTDNFLKAMLPERFSLLSNTQIEVKAGSIAVQFFINEIQSSLAGEISYGEQKLLSLACCVANGATLLLLDEPVAGIQPAYRNKTAILIRQLKEQGKTILLIEHNTDFISDVADKIFFLHDGIITEFNDIETLRADNTVRAAYIL